MKRFLDGKMRMLSLLLSLVLAVGLIQVNAVTASAAGTYDFSYAYDCQRDPAFPRKDGTLRVYSFSTPLNASGEHINEELHTTHTWQLTLLGKYAAISNPGNLSGIVSKVAREYEISANDIEIFQLTMDGSKIARGVIVAQSPELTVFFGDNLSGNGAGYVFSNTKLSNNDTVMISNDVGTNTHIHSWPVVTPTGNGTKLAYATMTCNCGETLTVTLTASDVTLPGDVFTAQVTTETDEPGVDVGSFSAARTLPEGLRISSQPGYKYSVSGSNFTPIDDPDHFTPKQGIYQASIQVKGANDNVVAELAVKYTVSDPAVTAATGDNRPIELMVMGLVVFSAMAAAAFVFDSKRRTGR